MKRDTIRERAREEQSTERAFTAAKLRQLLATFFFCASKIAFTHSAKLEKKKAIKHKYYQIYTLKDNFTRFRQARCWEQPAPVRLWLWQIFLSHPKMNVYPTGRVDTKNMKERASDGSIKETGQLYRCIMKIMHQIFFFLFFVKHNF